MPTSSAPPNDVFLAIADPTRRRLLELLTTGERPVNQLAESFAMSRPAVSQHLRILQDAGLVASRRIGREHHYRLTPEPLGQVRGWLQQYDAFWRHKLHALGAFLEDTTEKPS